MNWHPHVTVATVIEKENKFLLVKELDYGKTVVNQPAGHLEKGESLIQAAVRETLEETGWIVKPTAYLGVRHNESERGICYIRHTFIAQAIELMPAANLDKDIIEAVWMSLEEIVESEDSLRSTMVMHDIQAYLNDPHYPLDIIYTDQNISVPARHDSCGTNDNSSSC